MDRSWNLDPTEPRRAAAGAGWFFWLGIAALGAGLWLAWRAGVLWPRPLHDPTAAARPVTARGDLAADEQATIELFRRASPAVVHIRTTALRQRPFSTNVVEYPQGSGSGFVWDDRGYLVTNLHVIQSASRAYVDLSDGSTWEARLVGYAEDTDLAVLKIDAPRDRLAPIDVGSSSDLQVGQKVFAIGNPFGFDHTLTTGVVSGLDREIQAEDGRILRGLIQTDAEINPGNSGGPLLDSAGRLIGVNTAIHSPTGISAGIGFAIPVEVINYVAPQLIAKGRVGRAGLGVLLAPDQYSARLGVSGALIGEVSPQSAAAQAGLQGVRIDESGQWSPGDVVVGVDGKKVRNGNELRARLGEHQVGDAVTLEVWRDGKLREVQVILQEVQ